MPDYLVTYRPLAGTVAGREAAARFRLPPFIDASCRREPDLTHPRPSITAICRGRGFAPRLQVGDRVIYMTKAGQWEEGPGVRCWKLVAALQVEKRFESHAAAAAWYREQGLQIPSNVLVNGNPPEPWERTSRQIRRELRERLGDPDADPVQTVRLWNAQYHARAAEYPTVLACRPLERQLWSPPTLTEADLVDLFGRIPPTQTPPPITEPQAESLIERLSACEDAGSAKG